MRSRTTPHSRLKRPRLLLGCGMIHMGKNIANGSEKPQFPPVLCALCARRACYVRALHKHRHRILFYGIYGIVIYGILLPESPICGIYEILICGSMIHRMLGIPFTGSIDFCSMKF